MRALVFVLESSERRFIVRMSGSVSILVRHKKHVKGKTPDPDICYRVSDAVLRRLGLLGNCLVGMQYGGAIPPYCTFGDAFCVP